MYLVDAARQAEAAEAGVVQEPGHEQPRLAGHEAHHQQQAGEQTCGGRGPSQSAQESFLLIFHIISADQAYDQRFG